MKYPALWLLPCALSIMYGQDADVFSKAPPDVDEALRLRITSFYKAYISGKYSEAFPLVAPDAQDAFLGASKDTYKSCEISKINYSEEFTKATAVVACKGEFRWRTERMPATLPLSTNWKLVDGQWFWYIVKRESVETPFGISRVTPDIGDSAKRPPIPPDPTASVRDILSKVSVDKTEVQLKGYETSQDEVHILNNMPGPIHISLNFPASSGVSIKADKNEIPAGEKATILVSFSVEDSKALCHDCFKPVKAPVVADVHVEPTSQLFHIKVNFAIPPELLKQLPPELQKAQPSPKP